MKTRTYQNCVFLLLLMIIAMIQPEGSFLGYIGWIVVFIWFMVVLFGCLESVIEG